PSGHCVRHRLVTRHLDMHSMLADLRSSMPHWPLHAYARRLNAQHQRGQINEAKLNPRGEHRLSSLAFEPHSTGRLGRALWNQ
ncbi:MAG: hypothetical protein VXZ15_14330, partial [Planctomycetota bacterium]|nr:hypothetical protein [Planctomycetota bacterium]